MYGRISSRWGVSGETVTYRAIVPANTSATLYLPARDAASVMEGGKPAAEANGVEFLKYENGMAVFRLRSGSYDFISIGDSAESLYWYDLNPVASHDANALEIIFFRHSHPVRSCILRAARRQPDNASS